MILFISRMKTINFVLITAAAILLAACVGQQNAMIILPDPTRAVFEQVRFQEMWEIVESQNGRPEEGVPEWVTFYLREGIAGLESLEQYREHYVFIGENRGTNFSALNRWANGFNEVYDFPRLLARRVENRLVAAASLYPDDEYGEFFESLIRLVSNSEFSGINREEIFWIRRMRLPNAEAEYDSPLTEVSAERYEFFILFTVEKDILQTQLRQLMAGVRTNRPPTRTQLVTINRIQNTFFEGF